MHRKPYYCTLLSLLILVAVGCPPVVNPELGALRIINASSEDLTALFFALSGEEFGENRLTASISPGFSRTIINLAVDTPYDFRAEFGEGKYSIVENVVFREGQSIPWRITDENILDDTGVTLDILNMESDLLTLVNGARADAELDALSMTSDLRAVARAHSQDMIERDFFGGENPDGDNVFDRLDSAGIDYFEAGESLTYTENEGDAAVQVAFDSWMADTEGAALNVLDEVFTKTGIGIATDGDDYFVFTQVFIVEEETVKKIHIFTQSLRR